MQPSRYSPVNNGSTQPTPKYYLNTQSIIFNVLNKKYIFEIKF
jgi:hypothetical protein